MNKPAKVFITYSHRNKDAREKLSERLAVMEKNGEIEIWHDNEILPGDRWREEISKNLAGSDILLHLTSAASLASENCNRELTEALRSEERIRRIPIILEACDWKHEHDLSQIEALPDKGKPINEWKPKSKGWQSVVDGLRKAIQKTRQLMQEEQSEAQAYLMLQNGNFFAILGQLEDAINTYSQAIKIKSDFADAYCNRGIVHAKKGDHDQAIRDYNQAIELNPDFAEAYYNRGISCEKQDNHNQAIQDYSKAIELKPSYTEAYNNRGVAYEKQGNLNQAIQDYSKAIELNPNFANYYFNRGLAYEKQGNLNQAIQDCSKAIELNPDYAEAYNNRGLVYEKQGNFNQAIQDYSKAIELNPNYADAYCNRGTTYFEQGDFDQAIRDYNQAIALQPDFAEAYCNRGIVWLCKQAWNEAKSDLETAKEKGMNIAKRMSDFVEKYQSQLPEDIIDILTE